MKSIVVAILASIVATTVHAEETSLGRNITNSGVDFTCQRASDVPVALGLIAQGQLIQAIVAGLESNVLTPGYKAVVLEVYDGQHLAKVIFHGNGAHAFGWVDTRGTWVLADE